MKPSSLDGLFGAAAEPSKKDTKSRKNKKVPKELTPEEKQKKEFDADMKQSLGSMAGSMLTENCMFVFLWFMGLLVYESTVKLPDSFEQRTQPESLISHFLLACFLKAVGPREVWWTIFFGYNYSPNLGFQKRIRGNSSRISCLDQGLELWRTKPGPLPRS